ncbi:MAG: hypothetical protein NTX91_00040 [candidate division SR1 bacterium]|nr:hypothetical protein [candidate division SR1 bacterium]
MSRKQDIDQWRFDPIMRNGGTRIHPIVFDTSSILLRQLETLGTFEQDSIVIHKGKLFALSKAAAKQILKISHIQPSPEKENLYLIRQISPAAK